MSSLVYMDDSQPGIRRESADQGFVYFSPSNERIADPEELKRIARLAIPPAYSEVWICANPRGHLQATGRDARGRKQYRYHADWQSARSENKFSRMFEFGRALPAIRRRVERDLRQSRRGAPSRTTLLALMVRLLDATAERVGNEKYARENRSFGLTTLRNRHASLKGGKLRLRFRGKSGVMHETDVADPLIAAVVRRCQALPGQRLFQYEGEDGELHSIDSGDVNDYLREISGAEISAKDFRTWHGSVLALSLLGRLPPPGAMELLREVAATLRNTAAVCRKSYVHPRILEVCAAGEIFAPPQKMASRRGLSKPEAALLHFIDEHERRAKRSGKVRLRKAASGGATATRGA